ncbi:IS4 family transposase [Legionella bozemanae]|uniref:IS4 family transposase n=1 Tax=Legionella bozemanae TaxID=447 RepID=UPI00135BD987|nr:IS4 family transposase [Legionella bozemanae]
MQLLHKTLAKELPFIHKSRLHNLIMASSTLIKVNKLTLTSLGRHLPHTKVKTRSNIKRIDRLLGNTRLQKEAIEFYRTMSHYLLAAQRRPWIHVDWSCICSQTKLYLLRASLSMQGRSIVIYEECHPQKKQNNHQTHKEFLNNLKAILPSSVQPIIVTDAGFRAPWFSYVRALDWDFLGRLRHKNAIYLEATATWQLSHIYYEQATAKPNYLGQGLLTEKEQIPAHFILYKGLSKGRHRVNQYKKGRRDAMSKRYTRAHHEPWLLVTSLTSTNTAEYAVNIYRQRMQIEENFRDTKCTRYGFGLKESLSRSPQRMSILLLIAAISTFACWLAGIFTKRKGYASSFQAHSSKFTNILSLVYLGREALKKGISLKVKQFQNLLPLLSELNATTQTPTTVFL